MTTLIKTIPYQILDEDKRKILSRLFLVIIAFSSIFYVYFAGLTIKQMLEKNKNEEHFKLINREYQQNEEKYFRILAQLDLEQARLLGFIDPKKGEFIVYQSAAVARR
ncbi:MAG: hypothetical protein AB1643_00455 [Patescibacteria group bacterium]